VPSLLGCACGVSALPLNPAGVEWLPLHFTKSVKPYSIATFLGRASNVKLIFIRKMKEQKHSRIVATIDNNYNQSGMEFQALDSCGKRGKGKTPQTESRGGLTYSPR